MSEQHCRWVFDPFFTTRQQQGGLGLGLSISHGIVSRYGGTIEVVSHPGRGTTVTVRLPIKPTDQPTGE
jgi:signal transduction histidine kinase